MSDKACISRRGAIVSASLIAASTAMLAAGRAYGEEFAEATLLSPNDAISFLYIDNAQLEAGAEQNVVVSLSQHTRVSAAVLTVQDEAGAEQACTLSSVQDNALLFTFFPSGMGSCEVARLQFKADGAAYEIDLSEVDESYRSYKVAPVALAYSDGEAASGPDLHVYTGDGGDELAESASIEEAASAAVAAASRSRAANPEKTGPLVIALDPGHVGVSSGAVANGTSEANATWKIAQFCKAELDSYQKVTAVFTVTPDDRLGSSSELRERVQRALNQGADVLVSLHLNSTGVGNAYGAEVWAPHNASYNNETHAVGTDLGNQILAQLQKLGLTNRGVKFRWIDPDPKYDYPDGSNGDYYGIIREARKSNLPAIIVEHAFLDNWSDYNNFLNSDAKLQSLGIADARGIANYYGLSHAEGTVYRLYHAGTLDHHYTMDSNEYRVLGSVGWIQEGIAWYSDDKDHGRPVYRLYHAATLNHHYTKDYNEYQVLAGRGWKQEGVAWYGVAEDTVPVSRTPIMGVSQASVEQMAAYYRKNVGESTYPASVYTNYGAPTLQDFCTIVLEEAKAEGVRAEVVFAQAMKETGWLRFGGAVKVEQCNFCGLGAVNSAPGNAASFRDVRTGIRAQVQHLKAYASTDPLVQACVDPRFDLVKRGCAPLLEDLNGKWAVPGDGYGESIAKMIDTMLQGGR